MSATQILAWYTARCVNAPFPVISPTAQTPGMMRIRVSTGRACAVSSSPSAAAPSPVRSERRPVATSTRSAEREDPSPRRIVQPVAPDDVALTISTPVRTSRPSWRKMRVIIAETSGSSGPAMRSPISTIVTLVPNRAITCPISRPTAPPPMTSNDSGTLSVAMASRLVQCGMSANMGGTHAWAPVANTSAFSAVISSPSTSTVEGPVTRARPLMNRPPLSTKRSTATVSSHESVTSRMRRATGVQSGVMTDDPALPGIRRPSANRSAARTIVLDGMQPQYGHSPPTSSASMPTTWRPASASFSATSSPPGPIPTTTTSQCTGLETGPVGDVDGFHDWRTDVNLDLVVIAERQIRRVPFVDPHLLPWGGEEGGELSGDGPDLRGIQRDSPFGEELTQREAQGRAGGFEVDDAILLVGMQPVETASGFDKCAVGRLHRLGARDPDAVRNNPGLAIDEDREVRVHVRDQL